MPTHDASRPWPTEVSDGLDTADPHRLLDYRLGERLGSPHPPERTLAASHSTAAHRRQYEELLSRFTAERQTLHTQALEIHHAYHNRMEAELQAEVTRLQEEYQSQMVALEAEYQQQLPYQRSEVLSTAIRTRAALLASQLQQRIATVIENGKEQVRRHEQIVTDELSHQHAELEAELNERLATLSALAEAPVLAIPTSPKDISPILLVLPRSRTAATSSDLQYSSSDTDGGSSLTASQVRGPTSTEDAIPSVRRALSFHPENATPTDILGLSPSSSAIAGAAALA